MKTPGRPKSNLNLEGHSTSVRVPKELLTRAEPLKPYISVSQLLRDGLAISILEAERKFGKS